MGGLRLSLEHMTLLGLSPSEIIDVAEALGVDYVSLILDTGTFDLGVPSFLHSSPLVNDTISRLRSSVVKVHAAEGFLLDGGDHRDHFARLLEISFKLGVERGVVMVTDDDLLRAGEEFGWLCELAEPMGLQMSLEFVAFASVSRLDQAIDILVASGSRNGAISADILHLIRSGGSTKDLDDSRVLLGAAQLCDGPAILPRECWVNEAMRGRHIPGDGEFPLLSFLDALPDGLIVGVETPMGIAADPQMLRAAAAKSVAAARQISPRLG